MHWLEWLADVRRDVRFAARTLGKSPAFVATAVVCLALGIGANTAIFSLVDARLLRPLPYAQPERLVRLYETMPARGPNWSGSVSWANYLDWVEQARSFSGLAAYTVQSRNLRGEGGAERLKVVATTANFFDVLGLRPLLGRTFQAGEDAPGAAPVVVVSQAFWQRRFGSGAPVDQTLTLDGQPYTVVGVMPEEVRFPPHSRSELFVPLLQDRTNRAGHFLAIIGRLREGVTLKSADAELREVARRLEEAYPAEQAGRSATAVSLAETAAGSIRPALLMLLGAVAFVLLIACANVANLLLARAAARRHELAIRFALGASRSRIVRQLLTESLLLSAAGALLGLLLARWGLSALEALDPNALPLAGGVPLQWRVFGFLLLVAVASALLCGLAPALQATRSDVQSSLGESSARASASSAQHRFRSGLVVAEVALSLILLTGAGLLARSFATLLDTNPGLDARHVLTAHLPVPAGKYAPEQVGQRLLVPLLERARNIPGVRSAALISVLPIQNAWINLGYTVEGEPLPPPGQEPQAEFRLTSPRLFRSLGVPLLAGRDFTEEDGTRGELTVLINQSLAQRHFQGQNPVGRRLRIQGESMAIAGVVGDVRQAGLDQKPLAEIHFPYNHPDLGSLLQDVTLVLKTDVLPASVTPALREALRSVDADLPLYEILTMEEVIGRSVADRRLTLLLLGTFALVALALAAVGLYGVISYLVQQRTREIGIRMALGAQPADVVWLVMRRGALLAGAGIGVGLAGALGLSRLLESLLYGVSVRDPLTFAALAAMLGCVALLASWLPARRAARVDPAIAMQGE